MRNISPQSMLIAATLSVGITIPAFAHIERSEPLQSLRQSFFCLSWHDIWPYGRHG